MRTATEIRKDIQSLSINTAAFRKTVHKLGLEIIQHVDKHADASLGNALVKSLLGAGDKPMYAWLVKFSKLAPSPKTAGKLKRKASKKTMLKEAKALPYFKLDPVTKQPKVKQVKPMENLNALVKKILVKGLKHIDSPVEGDKVTLTQLQDMAHKLGISWAEIEKAAGRVNAAA